MDKRRDSASTAMKSQFAACARKTAYATSDQAEEAARGRFGIYLCPICARYHLTSSKPATPGKAPTPERKPTFESSLLARAKLKRPKEQSVPKTVDATCAGKARADGRVRLVCEGREVLSEPVQPASLRLEIKQGVKVQVRVTDEVATVIGIA
jgi:hypothetical protein